MVTSSSREELLMRVSFDASANIVHLDLTALVITPEAVDVILDATERHAARCRRKPYILSNWLGARLTGDGAEHYRGRIASLSTFIAGVFRYNLPETLVRSIVRTFSMTAKARSPNIYESKAEALEAIQTLQANEVAA